MRAAASLPARRTPCPGTASASTWESDLIARPRWAHRRADRRVRIRGSRLDGRRPVVAASWSRASAADVVDSHRLVYRADSVVNWCPGLGTVLANEEVTSDGRSDRGNFPVFRKRLRQWMMRITAYSDRLLDDLDVLDWPDKVKAMQRNWIGRSTGAQVRFATEAGPIEVFTTRPDTLFGATYMVLAPEHDLVDALVAEQWPGGHRCALDLRRGHPGAGGGHLPPRYRRRSPIWSARRTSPRPVSSPVPTPPIR